MAAISHKRQPTAQPTTAHDEYERFLASKRVAATAVGFTVSESDLSSALFDWQRAIVRWALQRGRAALFCETGTGKTRMQLEWARQVCARTGGDVLILAPLVVTFQTAREARDKLGIEITVARTQAEARPGITVTNYEMLAHFDPARYVGVVLDESSILKSFMGATKRQLIEAFAATPYRLACTATPAPNDHMELGNHAEFLGVMPSSEMLMRWFINDTMSMGHYRLKAHAVRDFWDWVASWAVSLRRPSDLGFSDDGFTLPALNVRHEVIATDLTVDAGDRLFRLPDLNATGLHRELRLTAPARAERIAALVNADTESWVVWCYTNYEADELTRRIPDAVEVRGSETPAAKERKLRDFIDGRARVLVSKPGLAGFGINMQHCARMAFVGLSYSFEEFYQAVRRCWRYGQTRPVDVYVCGAETEGALAATIARKAGEHERMSDEMVASSARLTLGDGRGLTRTVGYETERGRDWTLYVGDCVDVARTLPDASVHFSVFSPPFSNLYTYSDAMEDMGNSASDDEFFAHFDYLIPELHRVTVPGRLCAVHCKQLVNYKGRDGMAGLRDFRGDIIRHFTAAGWAYHSEVCIWKDPVIEMQRTKAHGLLYKQLRADSSFSRQGMAEYLLVFRRWPKSEDDAARVAPVTHTKDSFPLEQWQRYASPVWMDIRQTRVLNVEQARESQDEKHICPLQLDVIERALELWTNPGDVVLSPFAGIGSEGVVSLQMHRRFVGIELKRAYADAAVRYLRDAERDASMTTLWDAAVADDDAGEEVTA
jgi:hypothetical protein